MLNKLDAQHDIRDFFCKQLKKDEESEAIQASRLQWRLSCFNTGRQYASYISKNYFRLSGKTVLDLACGWGAHALAFTDEGARVVCSDLTNYRFSDLQYFASTRGIQLVSLRADCQALPFKDNCFDVILALDVVEHIASVVSFAAAVQRVLRPGGICIITSPPRLNSFIFGEPHWCVRGISLFPLGIQRLIATRVFRRTYPYPITRQYTFVSDLIHPFKEVGLKGTPVVVRRLDRTFKTRGLFRTAVEEVFWDFVVLRKPGHIQLQHSSPADGSVAEVGLDV
jgi:SAM-dependent methyltransferase